MSYCTTADLEEQISALELLELTDDSGSGAVDVSVVARAIADADAEIDSYCGGRYGVPFSPVPAMIRKLSVDLAIYNLYSRRSVLSISEERQKRYDNALRFLRDVARGLISLGADAPAPENSEGRAEIAGATRRFSRRSMRGF